MHGELIDFLFLSRDKSANFFFSFSFTRITKWNVAWHEKQLSLPVFGEGEKNAEETPRNEKKKKKNQREVVRSARYFWRSISKVANWSAPLFLFFHEVISDGHGFRHCVCGKKGVKEGRREACHLAYSKRFLFYLVEKKTKVKSLLNRKKRDFFFLSRNIDFVC